MENHMQVQVQHPEAERSVVQHVLEQAGVLALMRDVLEDMAQPRSCVVLDYDAFHHHVPN